MNSRNMEINIWTSTVFDLKTLLPNIEFKDHRLMILASKKRFFGHSAEVVLLSRDEIYNILGLTNSNYPDINIWIGPESILPIGSQAMYTNYHLNPFIKFINPFNVKFDLATLLNPCFTNLDAENIMLMEPHHPIPGTYTMKINGVSSGILVNRSELNPLSGKSMIFAQKFRELAKNIIENKLSKNMSTIKTKVAELRDIADALEKSEQLEIKITEALEKSTRLETTVAAQAIEIAQLKDMLGVYKTKFNAIGNLIPK